MSEFVSVMTKSNPNDVLMQIPINDVTEVNNYCNQKLYPYFNSKNKMFFECSGRELKMMISKCGGRDAINILDKTDIIIDVTSIKNKQDGGTDPMTEDEFRSAIKVMDGGGFILPNGATVYPNGKVELKK